MQLAREGHDCGHEQDGLQQEAQRSIAEQVVRTDRQAKHAGHVREATAAQRLQEAVDVDARGERGAPAVEARQKEARPDTAERRGPPRVAQDKAVDAKRLADKERDHATHLPHNFSA